MTPAPELFVEFIFGICSADLAKTQKAGLPRQRPFLWPKTQLSGDSPYREVRGRCLLSVSKSPDFFVLQGIRLQAVRQTGVVMKRQAVIAAMEHKVIRQVVLADKDGVGGDIPDGEVIIKGFVMEDGTEVALWGSTQVEVDDVWIDFVQPAPPQPS